MTPQELRNSILQLAIQGKLVDQRPEEGTGEELYQQIQVEKDRLFEEGKIKKSKLFSDINDDEKPFDIPKSWKWVRLGSLLRVIGGISYDKGDVTNSGIRILRGGNIQNMEVLLDEDDVFLPKEYDDVEKHVLLGDIIVVASTGSKAVIGKAGFVDREIPNTMIGAFLKICRSYFSAVNNYLRIIFDSEFYRKHIRDLSQGTNINNVKASYITEFAIPLPPLSEQKRIVAKVEELFQLIDKYEESWTKLEEFDKRFPNDLQKALLQMAIQGKLVEQRPEEGTGEELRAELSQAKKQIIDSGVLKGRKIKALRPNVNDTPFEIPKSWTWIRLGEVAEIFGRIGFRGYTKNDLVTKGNGAITISPSNIDTNGKTFFDDCTYISWDKYDESPEIQIFDGDLILVKTGSSYGKCGIVCGLPEKATINPQLAVLKYIICNVKYLDYALKSPMARIQYESFVIGTSIPTFSQEKLANLYLPLPPLAEQKRIAAKLEELLSFCERLK